MTSPRNSAGPKHAPRQQPKPDSPRPERRFPRLLVLTALAALGFLAAYGLTKFIANTERENAPAGMGWIPGGEFTMGSDADPYARRNAPRTASASMVSGWTRPTSPMRSSAPSSRPPATSPPPRNPDPRGDHEPGAAGHAAAARRRRWSRARWYSRRRTTPSRLTTSASGGSGRPAPTGGTPKGRAVPSTARTITPSSTSPGTTRRPTPNGRANGCRPRPSGSSPPAAAWTARSTSGATSRSPTEHPQCNNFQGAFPDTNTAKDGFPRTSPVKAFPPNGYGLYDMAGNVWQWCDDWYLPDAYRSTAGSGRRRQSHRPGAEFRPSLRRPSSACQRGGSFLCCVGYCFNYRPSARMGCTPGHRHVAPRLSLRQE